LPRRRSAPITAEAAVAQGTFYVYFRSKEDVARELVLRMGRRLRHYLTLATTGIDDRLEVERRGLHAFLKFVRDHPNLYRIVTEMQFVDPATHRRYYDDFAESYRVALEAAVARGEITQGDSDVRAWAPDGRRRHGRAQVRAVGPDDAARPRCRGRVRADRRRPGAAPP
jgi:AcrR family transcriptional regulator